MEWTFDSGSMDFSMGELCPHFAAFGSWPLFMALPSESGKRISMLQVLSQVCFCIFESKAGIAQLAAVTLFWTLDLNLLSCVCLRGM